MSIVDDSQREHIFAQCAHLSVQTWASPHWRVTGDLLGGVRQPAGQASPFLHGGSSIGSGQAGYRRQLDLEPIRGRHRPAWLRAQPSLAVDAPDRLAENTTQALIDIEEARTHLGITRWFVSGVSWGTTDRLRANPSRSGERWCSRRHDDKPRGGGLADWRPSDESFRSVSSDLTTHRGVERASAS